MATSNSKKNNQKKTKCFVVDTSLLLHDNDSIDTLGKSADVILPLNVLTELGRIQKSRAFDVGYAANLALETIEKLRGDHTRFNGGIEMLGTQYRFYIKAPERTSEIYKDYPDGKTPHSQIISICRRLQTEYQQVVLISKDKALRLQAASMNVDSEDYKNDAVAVCYQGIESLDKTPSVEELSHKQRIENRVFCINNNDKNIVYYRNNAIEYIYKKHQEVYGIKPKNTEQCAGLWALLDPHIKFVSLQGKAGCGKTFLALLAAIRGVLSGESSYSRIIVTRAMVSVDGDDLGALPGGAEEKISPYMDGIWDNLDIIKRNIVGKNKDKDFLEFISAIPFSLMRGRSLANTFLIIDEAQNVSKHSMKTLLTRVDDSSKVVIMGDNDQIDNPYLDARSNGMVQAINHFKNHPHAAHITLYANERGEISSFASKM